MEGFARGPFGLTNISVFSWPQWQPGRVIVTVPKRTMVQHGSGGNTARVWCKASLRSTRCCMEERRRAAQTSAHRKEMARRLQASFEQFATQEA